MRMKLIRAALAAFAAFLAFAPLARAQQVPVGWTLVTATNTRDGGSLISSGTVYFAPVDNSGRPISLRSAGGTGAAATANFGVVLASQTPGSGYSGSWTCAVNGGTFSVAATCTATVSGGGLVFAIASAGTYTAPPASIAYSGGTYVAGAPAAAVPTLTPTGTTVTAGGSGYAGTTATFPGCTNSFATNVTVVSGAVTAVAAPGGAICPLGSTVSILGSGQVGPAPLWANVVNGAYSILVPDSIASYPTNICYSVTVTDVSGNADLGGGYGCVQPAGSGTAVTGGQAWCTAQTSTSGGACNFDIYPPNLAANALVQTGPAGPAGPAGPQGPPGTGVTGALAVANNLSDLASVPAARANLGLGSIATKSAQGAGASAATIGTVPTGDILVAAADGSVADGGVSPGSISMPTAGLIARYDFHEGSGTTVHDVAPGADGSKNWTIISGVPAGAIAPPWIPATNGAGGGLAMGSDAALRYGLTAIGGTACQTLPIAHASARTIVVQFTNPQVTTNVTAGTWQNQYLLGSDTTGVGHNLQLYAGDEPYDPDNAAVSTLWAYEHLWGSHTLIQVFSAVGPMHLYIDGAETASYHFNSSNITLAAANWVLGCNTAAHTQNVSPPTAAIYIHHLAFYTTELTAQQAQQASAFLAANLGSTKSLNYALTPVEAKTNEFLAVGDSTTAGTISGAGVPSPYNFCVVTASCYGTSYATVFAPFSGVGWSAHGYGQGGAGDIDLPGLVYARDSALKGRGNFLHVAVLWIGINGISTAIPAPCDTIQALKSTGYDPWVMTLYSLNATAVADQGARDSYNYKLLQNSKQCGATGIIDLSADANIGVDGKNGQAPYWGAVSPHLAPNGYAYVVAIMKRVIDAYYGTTPDVWITQTGTTYTMNGYDRYAVWDNTANSQTVTLPDCIGLTGMAYRMRVKGASNVTTLQTATVTGQTEQIEGGSSLALTNGTFYTFQIMSNATASTAPGGCNYVRVQ